MSRSSLSAPFLKRIAMLPQAVERAVFPFSRFPDMLHDQFELEFARPITFFAGENGSGKSTLLEAIAELCGFHRGGGGDWHQLHDTAETENSRLAKALRPSWLPKVTRGYFFRADTFADVARYLDEQGHLGVHGGRRLVHRSHGESLMALFNDRFNADDRCIYLLDEPESALSPMKQLSFLALLHQWEQSGNAQFIIATHSPIILSYPGADINWFDGTGIKAAQYNELEHVTLTKQFLDNPEVFLRHLFDNAENG